MESGQGKKVDNFKYRARSSLPKRIWLPAAQPADGADGASVLCVPSSRYLDPACLLPPAVEVHERGFHRC